LKQISLLFSILSLNLAFSGIDNSLYFRLDGRFFSELSNYILEEELQDIVNKPLPNERGERDGIKYQINGIRHSVYFSSFSFAPHTNSLEFQVGVHNVHLHIDELKAKKNRILKTTCKNVDVYIAQNRPLIGRAIFAPTLRNNKIALNLTNLDFKIPEEEFHVSGPSSCSGMLGSIIKSQVKKFLKNQRTKLEKAVKKVLEKEIPEVEKKLNENIIYQEVVELGDWTDFTQKKIHISFAPHGLNIEEGLLEVYFSSSISEIEEKIFPTRIIPFAPSDKRLGFFGINPSIINSVYDIVFPPSMPFTELTNKGNAQVDEFFTVESFLEIVPDLGHLTSGEQRLRANFRLSSAPEITLVEEGLGLILKMPTFELQLMVYHSDSWMPYIRFFIDSSPEINIEQDTEHIQIKLTDIKDVTVTGQWEEGFPLANENVDNELFALYIKEIALLIGQKSPLVKFEIPEIELGQKILRPQLQIRRPFFGVELEVAE
jgi:hypothetical protein